MFGVILMSVFTLLHLYVFWRACSVPRPEQRSHRKALVVVGVVLWIVFVLAHYLGHYSSGIIASTFELVGMIWLGVLFLNFVSLLAADLLTGFGFFLTRHLSLLRGAALAIAMALSVVALVQGLRPPAVQHHEVILAGLPSELDGTVLVALSDLHLGVLLNRDWLEARLAQVQAQQPDLVVLLGDIFEGHGKVDGGLLEMLGRLSAPLGLWAIRGNHEFYGSHDNYADMIKETGFRDLRNRWTEIRPGLVLAGIENPTYSRVADRTADALGKALVNRPNGATILLSHEPRHPEKAAEAGVNLMLAGHTHGGQIWPFDYLTYQVFPLIEGRHGIGEMTLVISRGTGTWGPRMRLWHRGEILRITLRSGGSDSLECPGWKPVSSGLFRCWTL